MVRLAGVDLPREKGVESSLTYIFGIGRSTANKVLESTGVDANTRTRDLTDEEVIKLREFINKNFKVEGDLRRDNSQNMKRLMEIGSYRGIRDRKSVV